MAYIGRPLADWSRPLSDPSWRRWFDILKEMNVSEIGPTYGGGMGVAQTVPETAGGVYSAREFTAPVRGLRKARPAAKPMPEGHESFMQRYGRG